jgi:catechol-2,3-dioxygenase
MTVPVQLGHVSVPAKDPKQLAGFYRQLLGLEVTMEGSVPGLGDFVFLNERPQAELPLIALHTNPQGRHIALRVESLEALRTVCADAKARGIPVSAVLNHRVSISVYFHDPEGNMIELFWATGRKDTDRPYADPISLEELERPEAEVLERLAASA